MKLDQKGLLIVISGPSGVGKGTVRKALFNTPGHNLVYSVSMTTRKIREGEVNGLDYYFVSRDEFVDRIKKNMFLEYAEFVGNYYGTPADIIQNELDEGHEIVLEIEVNGAMQLRDKVKDAVFIFIAPPNYEALEKRLRGRGTETEDIINSRIEKAHREIQVASSYDYIVVNDEVQNAADKILAIIRAEHAKTSRTLDKYLEMLEESHE